MPSTRKADFSSNHGDTYLLDLIQKIYLNYMYIFDDSCLTFIKLKLIFTVAFRLF